MSLAGRLRWLAAVAILAAGVAGCGGGNSHAKKVPKVVGESLVQAASKLSQAQYRVDVPITIVRGKPPRHKVLKQDPKGGSEAHAGTKVHLEVSDGVE